MSWAFWGDVAIVIAIVGFVWGVIRWLIPRVRRRATPPVESATPPAVQPPPQLPQAPVVIVSPSQAPYQGGAVPTMAGPGSTTALTGFQTLGNAGAGNDPPGPVSQPGIHVSGADAGHAEDRP